MRRARGSPCARPSPSIAIAGDAGQRQRRRRGGAASVQRRRRGAGRRRAGARGAGARRRSGTGCATARAIRDLVRAARACSRAACCLDVGRRDVARRRGGARRRAGARRRRSRAAAMRRQTRSPAAVAPDTTAYDFQVIDTRSLISSISARASPHGCSRSRGSPCYDSPCPLSRSEILSNERHSRPHIVAVIPARYALDPTSPASRSPTSPAGR